uniref:Uncharacterized protein n=1 Tax=Cacopsylla melanoneura TaxID=428564 RepID=A0A8D9E5M9_9HEMI
MGTKTKQINISNLRKYFSLKEIKGGQAWSLFCDRSTDCAYNNSTDWRAKVTKVFGHKILFNLAVLLVQKKKSCTFHQTCLLLLLLLLLLVVVLLLLLVGGFFKNPNEQNFGHLKKKEKKKKVHVRC